APSGRPWPGGLQDQPRSAQHACRRAAFLRPPGQPARRERPAVCPEADRAIAYAQTTLAYGKAREAAPARRLVALDRLVDDVADSFGLVGHPTITFENSVPEGLEVDADPDQLFRVLVN